jgi:tRNA (cytidine/uridine-2'-O-)-methyltransferase
MSQEMPDHKSGTDAGLKKPAELLHIALLEPEIPPNTGNIARLCAAVGVPLHLIGRLGFRLDDRNLRRAGCDFWPVVDCRLHACLEEFEAAVPDSRVFCLSAHAATPYTAVAFQPGDCLLFGCESSGLPAGVLRRHAERCLCIPMPSGKVRSINLATAAGIVLYEALRQLSAHPLQPEQPRVSVSFTFCG